MVLVNVVASLVLFRPFSPMSASRWRPRSPPGSTRACSAWSSSRRGLLRRRAGCGDRLPLACALACVGMGGGAVSSSTGAPAAGGFVPVGRPAIAARRPCACWSRPAASLYFAFCHADQARRLAELQRMLRRLPLARRAAFPRGRLRHRARPGDSAASMNTNPHRVFSGVQPTGDLHLGNYLGAIAQLGRAAGARRVHLSAWSTCTRSPPGRSPAELQPPRSARSPPPISPPASIPQAQHHLQPEPGAASMPSSPGSSTAWPGSAGSTG